MDLKGLTKIAAQANEGVTGTIYQPNGDPYLASDGSEATITVVGAESERYRAAKLVQQRRAIKRASRGRMRDITPEQLRKDEIELTAAAAIDWHGWEDGGKPLPCTPENVSQILVHDHIREQVQTMIHDHADFFDRSSSD